MIKKMAVTLILAVLSVNAYATTTIHSELNNKGQSNDLTGYMNNDDIENESTESQGKYAWNILENKELKNKINNTFKKAGIKETNKWLYNLEGPSSPSKEIIIGDEDTWELFNICKAHDCSDNITLFIVNKNNDVKGILNTNGKIISYGNPDQEEFNILKHYLLNGLY